MSHFGIRAREQGVVWICLEEESDCREIEKLEGKWIRLSAIDDHVQYTPCTLAEEPYTSCTLAEKPAACMPKGLSPIPWIPAEEPYTPPSTQWPLPSADVARVDASTRVRSGRGERSLRSLVIERAGGVRSGRGERRGERKRVSFPKVRMADSLTFLPPALYEPFTVGPKAYQLRLLRERLSGHVLVPNSISVPFGVFDLVLESNPLIRTEYRKIIASLAKEPEYDIGVRLEYVRSLVESLDIDEAYLAALKKAVQERLDHDAPLIVRSSSNAEDLEEYSGAGLYESYPGVPLSELPRFLKKVWASKWTQRAVRNRLKEGAGAWAGAGAGRRGTGSGRAGAGAGVGAGTDAGGVGTDAGGVGTGAGGVGAGAGGAGTGAGGAGTDAGGAGTDAGGGAGAGAETEAGAGGYARTGVYARAEGCVDVYADAGVETGAGVLCNDVHMAVLIQELILADYAFVVHTHHPLTLNREQVYLEVVQGLGESLVGGSEGQGYRFVYDRIFKEVKRVGYASKGHKWVIGENGLPIRVVADYSKDFLAVGEEDGASEGELAEGKLSEGKSLGWKSLGWKSLMCKVAEIAIMIETAWGNRPQDIEGVIKGDKVFIVQTRPQM